MQFHIDYDEVLETRRPQGWCRVQDHLFSEEGLLKKSSGILKLRLPAAKHAPVAQYALPKCISSLIQLD